MPDADVVLCLDVFSIDECAAWWHALAGYRIVSHVDASAKYGERVRLRSELVPALELELHACRPRPAIGCTIGSMRAITIRVDDPEERISALAAALGSHAVIEAARAEGSITLRDSSGYHVCVEAHRRAGSACTGASPP